MFKRHDPAAGRRAAGLRIVAALAFALLLAAAQRLAFAQAGPTATPEPPTATETPALTPTPAPGRARLRTTENFLVLGADVRPGPWMMHTDSIMLLAIDHDTQEVAVLSIPRDLWVDIPGWGMDRINSAYFVGDYRKFKGGGPALAKEVVQNLLDVPIHHVILIKMDGLEKLVDALGGVTVTLDCPLYEQTPDPKDPKRMLNWTLPAGNVKLTGAEARKFATYRYLTADFGRAKRQQQLIWAIRNQAKTLDILPNIPQLWRALAGTFATDLNVIDVIRLSRFALGLDAEKVRGSALDSDVVKPFVTKGGASVLIIGDQASLDRRLGQMFSAAPLAEVNKPAAAKCPAAPAGFAVPKPSATPTP